MKNYGVNTFVDPVRGAGDHGTSSMLLASAIAQCERDWVSSGHDG